MTPCGIVCGHFILFLDGCGGRYSACVSEIALKFYVAAHVLTAALWALSGWSSQLETCRDLGICLRWFHTGHDVLQKLADLTQPTDEVYLKKFKELVHLINP